MQKKTTALDMAWVIAVLFQNIAMKKSKWKKNPIKVCFHLNAKPKTAILNRIDCSVIHLPFSFDPFETCTVELDVISLTLFGCVTLRSPQL